MGAWAVEGKGDHEGDTMQVYRRRPRGKKAHGGERVFPFPSLTLQLSVIQWSGLADPWGSPKEACAQCAFSARKVLAENAAGAQL